MKLIKNDDSDDKGVSSMDQLQHIASILTKCHRDADIAQFYAEDAIAPADINIEVAGLGPLTLPLNQETIKTLIRMSSKACFGLREQTLFDENVRNTQEITADKLSVTINQDCLTMMLSKMGHTLGLAENSVLVPHLHNMLLYGPGQFFERHQDSEKLANMAATLVIVLPSPHIGGDLIIEHGQKQHTFASENVDANTAKCIAFYADCQHQVAKIKQGYRVVLTYNLTLESKEVFQTTKANPKLKEAMQDYFGVAHEHEPQKLIYCLDHSYSEHSLRWNMLKGTDRINATAICSVAKELGLIPYLALVEIHQLWATDENDADPSIEELIDDDITLSYWIDSDNQKLPFGSYVAADNEICWTKETECFELFDSEYEGFMGNYGNTMDYWYRRAAIVLWKTSSQVMMNFRLNYDNAMHALLELTNIPGNEKKVIEIIEQAGKYLYQNSYGNQKSDLAMLTNIALYTKNDSIALEILSHFSWKILNADVAELLVKLQKQYGVNWCITLLNSWETQEKYGDYIIDAINTFMLNFIQYGGDPHIVECILDVQCLAIMQNDTKTRKWAKPLELKKSLPQRLEKAQQIIQACAAIENIAVLHKIIEHLISYPDMYPEVPLAELFLQLQANSSPEHCRNYQLLKDYLTKAIEQQLGLGIRAKDDWSISFKLPCKCEHCKIVQNFLGSRTEITKTWPIVMAIREHIIDVFNNLDLPVDLLVEKKGSPHKLVLLKTAALHTDAQKKFADLHFYRDKIMQTSPK